MLLADVVQASAEVATTRSRKAKVAIIAAVLTRLGDAEIRPATALLAGELPGGRAWGGPRCPPFEPSPRPDPPCRSFRSLNRSIVFARRPVPAPHNVAAKCCGNC